MNADTRGYELPGSAGVQQTFHVGARPRACPAVAAQGDEGRHGGLPLLLLGVLGVLAVLFSCPLARLCVLRVSAVFFLVFLVAWWLISSSPGAPARIIALTQESAETFSKEPLSASAALRFGTA